MPDYPMLRRQLQQMKDPNDPHTPDLFDAAHRHPGKSPVKTPRQKYYNPCNKRLDMGLAALFRAAGRARATAGLYQTAAH